MRAKLSLLLAILGVALVVPCTSQAQKFTVGSKVDFAVKDEDGKSVNLSKYKGKVVVLVFYASW